MWNVASLLFYASVRLVWNCKVLIRKSSMIEGVIGLSNKLDVMELECAKRLSHWGSIYNISFQNYKSSFIKILRACLDGARTVPHRAALWAAVCFTAHCRSCGMLQRRRAPPVQFAAQPCQKCGGQFQRRTFGADRRSVLSWRPNAPYILVCVTNNIHQCSNCCSKS